MQYLCKCAKCCGKFVCKTTWYSHNACRKRQTYISANNLAGTGAGFQSGLPDVTSSPPGDIDIKEPSEEEDLLNATDQMVEWDSVSI